MVVFKLYKLCLLLFPPLIAAHAGEHDQQESVSDTTQNYALKHMASEHHIDSFDVGAFFSLHDLDRNGVLDAAEIEAIYGVHHTDSQKKSPSEAVHAAKAQRIVREVLAKIDTNRDGVISLEEFEAAGLAALPDYSNLGAEGHHYDEESEFFLHHEEQYHNTPETQTDESYNHPEDTEHFKHHERIELEEENREREFQGLPTLSPEEAKALHDKPPSAKVLPASSETTGQPSKSGPKFIRPKKDPKAGYLNIVKEARDKPEWGQGAEGYRPPKTPAEKLRKNAPYKYKFRRNWGDF
ncbi:uncharacterized protein EI90DRAFT_2968818 [Cantharellus anzutake]|uniref:uncharacterized protein n=1 Tax=Cantharellus anzutake TaxID=1750568 RepID=UPI00190501E6|nr:uncharacterized protein EI90DRAFT_2968818 [Cantharellus anzutake]KAF8337071.1 hypothetical protein EI90DRAFT_2968818 [Cantharellus anzutake]